MVLRPRYEYPFCHFGAPGGRKLEDIQFRAFLPAMTVFNILLLFTAIIYVALSSRGKQAAYIVLVVGFRTTTLIMFACVDRSGQLLRV